MWTNCWNWKITIFNHHSKDWLGQVSIVGAKSQEPDSMRSSVFCTVLIMPVHRLIITWGRVTIQWGNLTIPYQGSEISIISESQICLVC